jgi:hypothetical protein
VASKVSLPWKFSSDIMRFSNCDALTPSICAETPIRAPQSRINFSSISALVSEEEVTLIESDAWIRV